MIDRTELDLRIAAHHSTVARLGLPADQRRAQRAALPGTLAAKFAARAARFAPHPRPGTRPVATTGAAHS